MMSCKELCLRGALLFLLARWGAAQIPEAGHRQFDARCAVCHGGDAMGGEHGPAIVGRLAALDNAQLATLIRQGLPNRGMPSFDLSEEELRDLVTFLGTLRPPSGQAQPVRGNFALQDGKTLEGLVMNRGFDDVQLLGDDQRIHLLRRSGNQYRQVTSQADWPVYHGALNANRYSALAKIDKTNIGRMAPKWVFTIPSSARLQVTPVVVEGVMYVTSANECYALDAGSGKQIWHYQRPRTAGLAGNAAGGINRGVAVNGDRVFMDTDHAHIIALNRFTGKLIWETEMADWHQNYNATSAPLTVGNLVVSGTAGGDEGARGFVAAFDQETGKEAWRFWTVPNRGEAGSETWKGDQIAHPGGVAWGTGSYDPNLGIVYWQTGNAGNDLNGDEREGDNLYSASIVALDAKTGKLKWHYQYTPHDVWDWDAVQPPVLVDAEWQGQMRKLLLHANRNGFFYVLDRTNGKLLRATPLVQKLSWAKGIGPDGRPILNPNQIPTTEGTRICPALEGATNWFSTSYNPGTHLYYVQTLERCALFVKQPMQWVAGRGYMGGTTRAIPGENAQKVLRAFDVQTGKPVWEVAQEGKGDSWGGVLSTASGVVFYGDDSGEFAAVDASSGKNLWHYPANQLWKASPMTYMFDNKQYVAIASGQNIIAFGVVE
jgi:alcohol dehydrogenase (cytochrome c)